MQSPQEMLTESLFCQSEGWLSAPSGQHHKAQVFGAAGLLGPCLLPAQAGRIFLKTLEKQVACEQSAVQYGSVSTELRENRSSSRSEG